jgi:hypothetical protein
VKDWERERRRPRPRRVVDWVDGIWTGGERAEERRRLRPRWVSGSSGWSSWGWGLVGEEVGGGLDAIVCFWG